MAVLERLDAFRQHNELCTLVASTRDASASIEGFERWHMPPLPSRRVKGQLTRVPLYGELAGAGRELVEQACRNPLFLSMLTEVGDDDVPFDLDAGVDAARRLIVERAVRRRLGWSVGERPTPEAAFSSWLAHAMRSLSLGSTLELRYVVWTMLPPLVQRRVRALFILVAGAPVITASAIVALVLGLGVPGLLASLLATFLVFAVTYAGMARWPLQRSPRWEIVAGRRWSAVQVRSLGPYAATTIAKRGFWGAAVGVPAGLLQGVLFEMTPPSMDGHGWFIWASLAVGSVLVGFLGALPGGLAVGAIASAAFGMEASLISAVLGGVVVGAVAGALFTAVDLGDVRVPITLATARRGVSRAVWTSGLLQARFSLIRWLAFGVAAGGLNSLVHGGELQWLLQGLGAGVAGATFYGLVEMMSPIGSYVLADLGLRRSGILTTRSLNNMLIQLVKMRILVPADAVAAYRFTHPLIGELFETLDAGAASPAG